MLVVLVWGCFLLVLCSLLRRKEVQAGCVEFTLWVVLDVPGRKTGVEVKGYW